MSVYSVFLFVHFLGVIGLFAAAFVLFKLGTHLRRAATVEEIRIWLGLARSIAPLFPVSAVLLVVTGLHLAGSGWSFGLPWVVTALVTVLSLLPLGPFLQRPRFMAMGKAAMSADPGPVPLDLARAVSNGQVWTLAYMSWGAAIGLLWTMTQKPNGWVGATAPVIVLAGIGAMLGSRSAKKDGAARDEG